MEVNSARIKDAIRVKKLNGLVAAATHCGVNSKTLTKLLNGEEIEMPSLFRICDGLNLTVEDIYGVHKADRPHLVFARRRVQKVSGD